MRLARRKRAGARIEMVPLIDVVFMLLVFFIYAMMSMIVPRGVRVTLPKVDGSAGGGRETVAVSVGRRGELFVDRVPVTEANLVGEVRARLSEGAGHVVIHGDAQAPLESALRVLGLLRDGGVEEATFRVSRGGGE